MIGRYAVLAGRIHQDLAELERVVERLAGRLRPTFGDVREALLAFTVFLERQALDG